MASAALRARELEPRGLLPYARHLTDRVLQLDSGALATSFRLEGASFETADLRDLNDAHGKLNGAWRNLADDRLAVWHHLVRRESEWRDAIPVFGIDICARTDKSGRRLGVAPVGSPVERGRAVRLRRVHINFIL